ncbi:ligand-binding sensor domain-containing protein [Helicovermis profundi]|uniref:Uncharacterized protein n=1 Tax=Helicovermis profundi TaxID=3065157 RepID=A0AAU9E3C2_9FIRM|nr:hypothetical protein HLPR_13520 [Clostridia bacterium S502]
MNIKYKISLLIYILFSISLVNSYALTPPKVNTLEDKYLIIGEYIIYLDQLNQDIYDAAFLTIKDNQNIYYKSEFANGEWFKIDEGNSLSDIVISSNTNSISSKYIDNNFKFSVQIDKSGNVIKFNEGNFISIDKKILDLENNVKNKELNLAKLKDGKGADGIIPEINDLKNEINLLKASINEADLNKIKLDKLKEKIAVAKANNDYSMLEELLNDANIEDEDLLKEKINKNTNDLLTLNKLKKSFEKNGLAKLTTSINLEIESKKEVLTSDLTKMIVLLSKKLENKLLSKKNRALINDEIMSSKITLEKVTENKVDDLYFDIAIYDKDTLIDAITKTFSALIENLQKNVLSLKDANRINKSLLELNENVSKMYEEVPITRNLEDLKKSKNALKEIAIKLKNVLVEELSNKKLDSETVAYIKNNLEKIDIIIFKVDVNETELKKVDLTNLNKLLLSNIITKTSINNDIKLKKTNLPLLEKSFLLKRKASLNNILDELSNVKTIDLNFKTPSNNRVILIKDITSIKKILSEVSESENLIKTDVNFLDEHLILLEKILTEIKKDKSNENIFDLSEMNKQILTESVDEIFDSLTTKLKNPDVSIEEAQIINRNLSLLDSNVVELYSKNNNLVDSNLKGKNNKILDDIILQLKALIEDNVKNGELYNEEINIENKTIVELDNISYMINSDKINTKKLDLLCLEKLIMLDVIAKTKNLVNNELNDSNINVLETEKIYEKVKLIDEISDQLNALLIPKIDLNILTKKKEILNKTISYIAELLKGELNNSVLPKKTVVSLSDTLELVNNILYELSSDKNAEKQSNLVKVKENIVRVSNDIENSILSIDLTNKNINFVDLSKEKFNELNSFINLDKKVVNSKSSEKILKSNYEFALNELQVQRDSLELVVLNFNNEINSNTSIINSTQNQISKILDQIVNNIKNEKDINNSNVDLSQSVNNFKNTVILRMKLLENSNNLKQTISNLIEDVNKINKQNLENENKDFYKLLLNMNTAVNKNYNIYLNDLIFKRNLLLREYKSDKKINIDYNISILTEEIKKLDLEISKISNYEFLRNPYILNKNVFLAESKSYLDIINDLQNKKVININFKSANKEEYKTLVDSMNELTQYLFLLKDSLDK